MLKATNQHFNFLARWVFALLSFGLFACSDYTPKPHGYPRIYFPEKSYKTFNDGCAYQFDLPEYALMEKDTTSGEACWYNLKFPLYNATIYLSYKEVTDVKQLDTLSEDAYKLAMKNNIKALAINEREIYDSTDGNYGVIYDLYGETATPFNFYLTDNKKHYLRGAFYFDQHTKTDSVAPVFDFLKEDIIRMLNTLEWKD